MNMYDHNKNTYDQNFTILSMADLYDTIPALGFPKQENAFLKSAVKRACALLGQQMADVPADPRMILTQLEQISPAMANMTEQSLANVKSRVRKVLKKVKGKAYNPRSRFPLKGEWGNLQASLDTKMQRSTSRLFHFAARLGVLPSQMSDAVIERFELHLRDEAMVGNWERPFRGSIKAWNAIASTRDLPLLTLPPVKRTSYWINQSEWPPSLVSDLNSVCEWLAKPALLEGKAAKALKPATIQQYRHNVTIAVSALAQSGVPISTMQRLAEVVKPAQVDRVLTFLHERAGGKVTPQMLALALRARTIARWCKASDDDLAKLDLIVNSVEGHREKKRGMTAKNRALLDRLEDQRFADHVQLLPLFLLDRATKRQASRRSAALARTAMAIELLLVCSVRRANLVSLELGKSIKQIGEGKDTRWIIECDSEEVKNNQHLRFTLKGPTAAMLELYLREWRPKLCSKPNPWLFPAADGTCIDPKTMAYAVKAHSKMVLGVPITPHQFRHISAELYLMENPEKLLKISDHLGHSDVNTTRYYYARPKQREASRHFQEHVLKSRETARIRIKLKQRRRGGGGDDNGQEDVL